MKQQLVNFDFGITPEQLCQVSILPSGKFVGKQHLDFVTSDVHFEILIVIFDGQLTFDGLDRNSKLFAP